MKSFFRNKRRLVVFGGVSVFAHAALLAFFIGQSHRTPSAPEIAVEFEPTPAPRAEAPEPAPEPEPLVKTAPQDKPAPERSAAGANAGAASRKGAPRPASAPRSIEAVLASADLSALRADLVQPAALTVERASSEDGLAPVEPEVHLADGTIDKLIEEGHGYADSGPKKGRKKGVFVSGVGKGGKGKCPRR